MAGIGNYLKIFFRFFENYATFADFLEFNFKYVR